VGGGVRTPEAASAISKAGADFIVIGNMLEEDGFEPRLASIIKAIG